MTPARILIVNADDFGMAPSVNHAIAECHKSGNVTSTTMMVSMPGSEEAAQLARSLPDLRIGLHFSLTEGTPLTRPASLLGPVGRFLPRGALMRRLLTGKADSREIRVEFEAQLERILAMGIKPTHVDSHEHVHMSPAVFRAIAPVVARAGLPMRLVAPPWELETAARRPVKFLKQLLMRLNSARFRGAEGIRSNDLLISIHDLPDQSGFSRSDYDLLFRRAAGVGVVELMVHPYLPDGGLRALYGPEYESRRPFIAKCEREYELLSAPATFAGTGFALGHYGRI